MCARAPGACTLDKLCNATKTERLDKGVHYLALLQQLSAAEAEATAPSTAHQQALGTANRRLMGQALKFLGRFPEAIAFICSLLFEEQNSFSQSNGWDPFHALASSGLS